MADAGIDAEQTSGGGARPRRASEAGPDAAGRSCEPVVDLVELHAELDELRRRSELHHEPEEYVPRHLGRRGRFRLLSTRSR